MDEWPTDRFTKGFALLVLVPRSPPGVPLEAILADLGLKRTAFFRLIADLRRAGFEIESQFLPDGRKGYYCSKLSSDLMKKLGLA